MGQKDIKYLISPSLSPVCPPSLRLSEFLLEKWTLAMLVCDCAYSALNVDTKEVTQNTFFGNLTCYLGALSIAAQIQFYSFLCNDCMICHPMNVSWFVWSWQVVATDLLLEAIFQWTSLCIYLVIFFKEIYVEHIPEGGTDLSKVWAF